MIKDKTPFVAALFSLIQASLGNLLSPAALALPAINLFPDPRCAVSLFSHFLASMSKGLP